MECIVLSGGLGTRLGPITKSTPKALLPINGTPLIEHLLIDLSAHGFKKVILAVGHLAENIERHVGKNFADISIQYSLENRPLGTGGAMAKALSLLDGDEAFVINGDTLQEVDYQKMHRAFLENSRLPTLAVRNVDDVSRYGSVLTEGDSVIGFSEKQNSGPGNINAGCYILPSNIFEGAEVGEEFSFERDYLPKAVTSRVFKVFELKTNFVDIGTPESLRLAQGIRNG